MPAAFAAADLVVCRSGAGAVGGAGGGGPARHPGSLPFAADDHQLRNAEAFVRAGAARLTLDQEFTGERLVREVTSMAAEPGGLERMGRAARSLARPGAARRAAIEVTSRTSLSPVNSWSRVSRAAPARTKASALRSWWSSAAKGKGTRMAGRAAAASSATAPRTRPAHHQVRRGEGGGHVPMKGVTSPSRPLEANSRARAACSSSPPLWIG